MPLYTFVCGDCGQATERLAGFECVTTDCFKCGSEARRAEVNRVGVSGFAVTPRDQRNYRQSFSEYREASQEVDYHYSRAEANGDPVKSPNLYGAGMAQAKAMGA